MFSIKKFKLTWTQFIKKQCRYLQQDHLHIANLSEVKTHLQNSNPDIIFLPETGLHSDTAERDFAVLGHSPLITKHDNLGRRAHGIGVAYIRESFTCGRINPFEDTEQHFICSRIALIHSFAFVFSFFRPHTDGVKTLDAISDKDELTVSHYICVWPFSCP